MRVGHARVERAACRPRPYIHDWPPVRRIPPAACLPGTGRCAPRQGSRDHGGVVTDLLRASVGARCARILKEALGVRFEDVRTARSERQSCPLKERYDNFIGGRWVARRREVRSQSRAATGKPFTEVPRSTPEDIELALDAAHAAKDAWARLPRRALPVLNAVADAIEKNSEMLAVAESWENASRCARRSPRTSARGRPLPLLRERDPSGGRVDHRDRQGHDRISLPGAPRVVGQIIPFNFRSSWQPGRSRRRSRRATAPS